MPADARGLGGTRPGVAGRQAGDPADHNRWSKTDDESTRSAEAE